MPRRTTALERLRATARCESARRRVGSAALHGLVGPGRPDARQAAARALGRALRRRLLAADARAAGRLLVAALPGRRGARRRHVRELAAVRGPAGRRGLHDAQALDDELRARRSRGARRAHPRGDAARDRHPHRHARHLERRRGAAHHARARALSRVSTSSSRSHRCCRNRFYAGARRPRAPEGGFQREYYFRKLEELRRDTGLPISCHWWTPPIVQPEGVSRARRRRGSSTGT